MLRLWTAATRALGPAWSINGSVRHRYFGNLNVRKPGVDGARLIADLRDIAFSLGSACASESNKPSRILAAIGLTPEQARGSIRLGFGRYTTDDELIDACERISAAAFRQEKLKA